MSSRFGFSAGTLLVASGAILALTAFGSSDALAQSFNVHDFSCSADPFGVHVDVRGLGNTNVCLVGSATVTLNCACVGGGGNCPRDAKKQSEPTTFTAGQALEPKNGRVVTTFELPFTPTDALCSGPICGSGQKTKLISWEVPAGGADFTLCTTNVPAGQPCNCIGQTILATEQCGPDSDVVFGGKRGSCQALFD